MAVDKLTGIKIKNNDGTYSAEIPISVQLENVIGAGTAAAKDVPASGNASTSQVVMGNDTRLTNARPASDVSAWAKASTKPSYTATEVGAIASTLKGAASGVAELDSAGKVPSSQLPSYVDDVLEYDAKSSFPSTGEAGKIYVDKSTNLTYRWSGTAYIEISPSLALGTTSSTAFRGDYGNTAYNHATNKGSAYTSGMYKITTNSEGHVTAATAIQKSDITGLGIPGQDTTYSVATTSANGLMSSTDKTKLNGIATGAEVNQNAFSNVKVGSTTIEADSKTDTLELAAGSNITLTPDATGDKITIAATDTTYSDATTSVHGLMSTSDKTKLNGIASGAEVNQNAFSNVKVGSTTIAADGKTDTLELAAGSNITLTPDASGDKVTIAATDTTYSAATTSAAGLMSAADKTKLNGIAAGAQVNTVTSVAGKTGAVTLTNSDVGLGNVGNFKAVSTVANQGLSDTEKANARANIGAGASSFDGTWASLSGKPILGTASAKDVASSGNASSTQVVMGNDTRLTNSRPASDVSAWAKASSKPSYTASEVGAIPTSQKGAASGVAELDANGKVPSSQLPSYVDDVLEYSAKSSFPSTGEAGKIYVDTSTNLTYRWSGSAYVEISPSLALGTTSSTAFRGDYGNTAYTHATDSSRLTTAKSSGLYKIATTAQGHVASVTAVAKSDITGLGIPAQDTTYSDATTSTHGLMSTSDKSKLDGIASGAEVNQNAFSNVKVGSTTVAADGKTDTLELAGSNVTLTPDATNDKVTIGITKDNVTAALGYTPPTTNTTYSNATTSTAGLMSSTDKSKLDGIASGAQVNTVTSVAGKTGAVTLAASDVGLGNVGNFKAVSTAASQGLSSTEQANARANIGAGTSSFNGAYSSLSGKPTLGTAAAKDVASSGNASTSQVVMGNDTRLSDSRPASDVYSWAKASSKPSYTASEIGLGNVENKSSATIRGELTKANVTTALGYTPPTTDTTYSDATTSASGLMSSSDKTKLNGIATGAEVNQNAFSNVKVGSTTIAADGKTDTLELVAGSNITLTPDASGDKVTIAATGGGGDDYLIADDAGSAASTNPINADQLNGHSASYFLTSGDIVDGLNSTSTTDALSANQGRILYSDISNLQTDVTTLQTAVAGKANIANPTFTGDAKVTASTNYSTAKLRNVILSTSEPTAADGNNGDIWIVYGN